MVYHKEKNEENGTNEVYVPPPDCEIENVIHKLDKNKDNVVKVDGASDMSNALSSILDLYICDIYVIYRPFSRNSKFGHFMRFKLSCKVNRNSE